MFHFGRKQAFIVAVPAGFHNTGHRAEERAPVTENGCASRSAPKSLAAAAEIAEGRRFRFALRKIRVVAEIGISCQYKRKRLPLPQAV
ncbi:MULTISPECIES: hypothetical protein [unclassified Neisseria]|uniref:hypothetical protein n=1 Tax=unclassified Neisseria TaxID=2623750 RepID=UPI001071C2DB|nr:MULTISPECIES: hypothetical protein [unclassified Neisseria]MBF0804551.1 hypothetical protein [Neisseria sp. 19428wB4_WF04]TFU40452.1 hypothetical protein E4T99_09385 [Neisseria sp. WF04]